MTISIQRQWSYFEAEFGTAASDDDLEIRYNLYTTDDEDEGDIPAFLFNPSNIPRTYLGMAIAGISLVDTDDDDMWRVVARYRNPSVGAVVPTLEVGDVRWTITGGSGSTAQRQFSESLVSENLPSGKTEPALSGTDWEKVIGIVHRDGDYEAEGVSVPVGGTQISVETVWSHANAVTALRLLRGAEHADVKAVNNDQVFIFPPGTLQVDSFNATFQGGTTDPSWDVAITFNFAKNLTNIDIGGGITIPAKKGHEHLDILYSKKAGGFLPLPVPIRAAVHKIFPEVSFRTEFGL